jgi:hypothetical protein
MPCPQHKTCDDCQARKDAQLQSILQSAIEHVVRLHHGSLGTDHLRVQVAQIVGLPEPVVFAAIHQMAKERDDATLRKARLILSNHQPPKPPSMPALKEVWIWPHQLEHRKLLNANNAYQVQCVNCQRQRRVDLPGYDWQDNAYIGGHCWPWSRLVKPHHRELAAWNFTLPEPIGKA